MRYPLLTVALTPLLSLAGLPASAQEIVKIPAKDAPTVARPDDLFALPPGQWHFAKQLWSGQEPCDDQSCEAGYTSGDLVISVERSGKFVRLIAGLRGCESTSFSEIETGDKPGKYTRGRVADQVKAVVRGVAKTCGITAPKAPKLDVAQMFPAKAGKR